MSLLFQANIPFHTIFKYLRLLPPESYIDINDWSTEQTKGLETGDMVFTLEVSHSPYTDAAAASKGIGVSEGDKFKATGLILIFRQATFPMGFNVTNEKYETQFVESVLAGRAEEAQKSGKGFYFAVARSRSKLAENQLVDLAEMQKWGTTGTRVEAARGIGDPVYAFLQRTGINLDRQSRLQPVAIDALAYHIFTQEELPAALRLPNLTSQIGPLPKEEAPQLPPATTGHEIQPGFGQAAFGQVSTDFGQPQHNVFYQAPTGPSSGDSTVEAKPLTGSFASAQGGVGLSSLFSDWKDSGKPDQESTQAIPQINAPAKPVSAPAKPVTAAPSLHATTERTMPLSKKPPPGDALASVFSDWKDPSDIEPSNEPAPPPVHKPAPVLSGLASIFPDWKEPEAEHPTQEVTPAAESPTLTPAGNSAPPDSLGSIFADWKDSAEPAQSAASGDPKTQPSNEPVSQTPQPEPVVTQEPGRAPQAEPPSVAVPAQAEPPKVHVRREVTGQIVVPPLPPSISQKLKSIEKPLAPPEPARFPEFTEQAPQPDTADNKPMFAAWEAPATTPAAEPSQETAPPAAEWHSMSGEVIPDADPGLPAETFNQIASELEQIATGSAAGDSSEQSLLKDSTIEEQAEAPPTIVMENVPEPVQLPGDSSEPPEGALAASGSAEPAPLATPPVTSAHDILASLFPDAATPASDGANAASTADHTAADPTSELSEEPLLTEVPEEAESEATPIIESPPVSTDVPASEPAPQNFDVSEPVEPAADEVPAELQQEASSQPDSPNEVVPEQVDAGTFSPESVGATVESANMDVSIDEPAVAAFEAPPAIASPSLEPVAAGSAQPIDTAVSSVSSFLISDADTPTGNRLPYAILPSSAIPGSLTSSLLDLKLASGLVSGTSGGLIAKLEQQAQRAGVRLEEKLIEIQERLLKDRIFNLRKLQIKEEASDRNINALKSVLFRKIHCASDEVKNEVQACADEGRTSLKDFEQNSTRNIIQEREELLKALDSSPGEIVPLTINGRPLLSHMDRARNEGYARLDEEARSRIEQMDSIAAAFREDINTRLQQLKSRIEQANGVVRAEQHMQRDRSTMELEALRQFVLNKLDRLLEELSGKLTNTGAAAALSLSIEVDRLCAELLLARLASAKQTLPALTLSLREQLRNELDHDAENRLADIAPLLTRSREDVDAIALEADQITSVTGDRERADLEQMLQSISQFFQSKTEEFKALATLTREEMESIDAEIATLSNASSIESQPEIAETRGAILQRLQKIGTDLNDHVNDSLRGQIANMEDRARVLQEDLISSMEADAYTVRKTADSSIGKLREKAEAIKARIKTTRDQYT
jgi:hypothetical protein